MIEEVSGVVTSGSGPQLHVEVSTRPGRARASCTGRLVDELLAALEDGFPPSLDLVVVDSAGVLVRAWGGVACCTGPVVATAESTVYDLASLTKVVATTTLALVFVQEGRWDLDDNVASWVPGFPRDDLNLVHLLTHTSGLVAHRPFFLLGRDRRAIRSALFAEAAAGGPPGEVLYSDLNFILLGWAIERCTGKRLDQLFCELVAEPLEMSTARFRPTAAQRLRTAATELDGDQRVVPGLVWGEVHDGNAWALGGVAGHAGLFASADDLARFVGFLLHPTDSTPLTPRSVAAMGVVRAASSSDVRGLGWRLAPEGWGDWPTGTFWHTGFTGTSLLVAPAAGLAVVLLTNAVHPHRQLDRQSAFRANVHEIVAGWLS